MSDELRVAVPPDLVEAIARHAADLVRDELRAPEWLTLDEAAERYRTTAGALRWRAQRGRLPGAVKDESRWLVNARDFDAALIAATLPRPKKRASRRMNGRGPGTGGISSHA